MITVLFLNTADTKKEIFKTLKELFIHFRFLYLRVKRFLVVNKIMGIASNPLFMNLKLENSDSRNYLMFIENFTFI